MPIELWKNKEWLVEESKTKSINQIAKEHNVGSNIIHYWIKKYNLKSKFEQKKKKQLIPTQTQFGNLTVINCEYHKGQGWQCTVKCLCGNITKYQLSSLMRKKGKNCNQCRIKLIQSNVPSNYFNSLKRTAQRRNIICKVTKKELCNLYESQQEICTLTGIKLKFGHIETTASLDRINSNEGYTIDNIWWVHKDINLIKRDYILKRFLTWCLYITQYQSSKNK